MSPIDLKSLIINNNQKTVIYLSGIGGIGISAIAEILYSYGIIVIGSDQNMSSNILRLKNKNIKIYIGQDAKNIQNHKIDYLVRSTAIKDNNPEIIEARAQGIQILSRADILAAILKLKKSVIISGSHGKTTTTSLIGHITCFGKIDPTVITGGIMNDYNSNVIIGNGDWMVAEADESDGSFTALNSSISVITNIETEHMDYFKTEDNLKQSFLDFINKVPKSGYNVICYDDIICQELIYKSDQKNIISYGFSPESDIVITNVKISDKASTFRIYSNIDRIKYDESVVYELGLVGNFNILNAMAAVIVGSLLEIDNAIIRQGLKSFKGIKRRMTLIGTVGDIKIYDDYAHHPTEIEATLLAIKNCLTKPKSKIIAVFQPHRYSRVRDHYAPFIQSLLIADKVLITDVYAAGEAPISGISKEIICNDINIKMEDKCSLIENIDQLPSYIKQFANDGDVVVCLGAGDITKYANSLPIELVKIL